MKQITLFRMLTLAVLVMAIAGCNYNTDDTDDPYLISFTKKGSYFPNTIKDFYSVLTDDYPEIQPIADEVKYAIDIYTITYKTKFDGQELVASGLV